MEKVNEEHNRDQEMNRVRASLDRLERGEWWRWSSALVIMLILTIGVFVLTHTEATLGWAGSGRIVNAEHGLVGLVLLFDAFVVYQRLMVGRLRRQLALQMAAIATLEAIRPSPTQERDGQTEHRSHNRTDIDELLKLEITSEGRRRLIYGRIDSLSDIGLGAVVPDAMAPGDLVTLSFTLGRSADFRLEASVCQRRGFHYGFEFRNVPDSLAEKLAGALRASKESGN